MLNRRNWCKQMSFMAGALVTPGVFEELNFFDKASPIRIGACDWSLGKNSDIGAFDVAKKVGLAGIMVNMGGENDQLHLRNKLVQEQYLAASKKTGVKISSLGLACLNDVPYKSDPRTEQWVYDSVTVAKRLGVTVVLLAFFEKNDLRNDPSGTKEVISRLKKVMPYAEKMGIILGIESYLNAAEHLHIINEVGSKNLKVYYDFRNTADAGYDTIKEFKLLGKDHICELHMKENGFLLGEGTLDWPAIAAAIRETGYYGDGWMQIEWAMPDDADIVTSYIANRNYLQTVFSKK
jgi:L-ribulose-5-phosphate 3-epimerase